MTENEAIRELEWAKNRLMQSSHMDNNRMKAFNMAIQALEKQMAKKPLGTTMAKDKDTSVGRIGRCPCCNGIIAEDMLWREDCGQKLDWSEE